MKKIISFLFSFELSFALFLNAGEIKDLEALKPITSVIDFTAFMMIVNFSIGMVALFKQRNFKLPLLNYVIFAAFLLFLFVSGLSFYLTPSDDVAVMKMIETGTIIFWTFFSSLFIVTSPERIQRLIIAFGLCGAIIGIGLFQKMMSGSFLAYGGEGGFGGGYQRAGTLSGFNIILCLISLVYLKRAHTFFILLIGLSLAALIFSAHRSTWLAMPLALLFTTLFSTNRLKIKNKLLPGVLIIAFVLGIGSLISFIPRGEYMLNRFMHNSASFDPGPDGRGNPRLYKYIYSVKRIFSEPDTFLIGIGYGNFKRSSGLIYRHPHNIFIEIFLELGVFVFLASVVFIFGWRWVKTPKKHPYLFLQRACELLFWYFLIHANFGGDIPDNRNFWVFLLCIYNLNIYLNTKYQKVSSRRRTSTQLELTPT